MKLSKYVWWDRVNQRFDITTDAIIEQTDPKVDALIKGVLRSWFFPPKTPIQLPLKEVTE